MKFGLKHKRLSTICAILVCVIFLSVAIGHLVYGYRNIDRGFYIFQDIDECRNLASYENDAEVKSYDSPEQDKNYKGQPLISFVGMNYKSKTMKYKLFAYEFENSDQAKQYFSKITGKNYDNALYVSKSSGMSSYRIVVAFENRAYCIETSNRYIKQVDTMLASQFSNKLK